jgi:3-oxoacyl-[acyl-carrier-protein] synthase-3
MSFRILGTGRALPSFILKNADLCAFLDTSDEWITTRTGIGERRIVTTESVTSLSSEAAKNSLENAGVEPGELDLIVCATLGGDFRTPALACLVQKELGANCPAFDINAACSGFIYALDTVAGFFARKSVKKALVVGFEEMSRYVDWRDRATCVLFGDGGGAVVLGEGDDLLGVTLSARGDPDILNIRSPRGNSPFAENPEEPCFLHMNGREVYKFAVNALCADIEKALSLAGLAMEDVAYFLPHQANIRIIEAARDRLGIPAEKFVTAIERYGNTSAGSIPILLDEANRGGLFKNGDILVLSAFGSGLTSGCCVVRWTK